jgi:hypothetical protein
VTFRRNGLPPYSGLKNKPSKLQALILLPWLIFDPENGGRPFLLNADKPPSDYMASYSRRLYLYFD